MAEGVGDWILIEEAGLYTERSPEAYKGVWHDAGQTGDYGITAVDVPGISPTVSLPGQTAPAKDTRSLWEKVTAYPGEKVQEFTGWVAGTAGEAVKAAVSPLVPIIIILLLAFAVSLKLAGVRPQLRVG